MSIAVIILLVYFLGGLVTLLVFDLATKGRIRSNMPMAGTQAQIRMAEANSPIGPRAGMMLMLIITWLFWPLVLVGAITDTKGGNNDGTKEQRAYSENRSGGRGTDSDSADTEAGEQPAGPDSSEASEP